MNRPFSPARPQRQSPVNRRGVIVVLTGFMLTVLFAFVAMSVDSGRIVLTETEMQNAVDAAALAASQEITAAIHAAGQGQGSATIDANSIAIESARQMAADVADANGVFVDPAKDVFFGKRKYDSASDSWPVVWGESPYNVVKVVARRNNADDLEAPDGELPLAFGWAVGRESVPVETTATAFVESRDLVLVLDFSGSMNDDSTIGSSLSTDQLNAALDNMWDELLASKVKWPDITPARNKWKNKFGGNDKIDSYAGTYVESSDTDEIFDELGLGAKYSDSHAKWPGQLKWPFPQAGRDSSGMPNSMPSEDVSEALWKGYIDYTKNLSGDYEKKYGFRTLMSYLQRSRYSASSSEDLWRTSHYPYAAVKDGASLFLDFLADLDFGDEIGVVSYGTYAVWEDSHYDEEVSIDLTSDPISSDYSAIDSIQRRHQAGHYDAFTGIGDGVLKAREMLVGEADDSNDQGHARYGARPTIILMTDGRANRRASNWSMPSGFDWDKWTDYDGDGDGDYSTSDKNKQYAFYEALEAIERGITIHTMAVGAGADRDLMRAIAHAGGGIFISVPGGATIAEMETQMLEAFGQIAAKVPPAQLVYDLAD